jgi:hypothetical protein
MAKKETAIDFSGWVVEYNPSKKERLERLQREIRRNAKMKNPQYRNAVERNRRMEAYNNMIRRINAEVSPTKQQEILNKWCSGFGNDK